MGRISGSLKLFMAAFLGTCVFVGAVLYAPRSKQGGLLARAGSGAADQRAGIAACVENEEDDVLFTSCGGTF